MEKRESSDFWLIEKMRMGDEQALEDFVKKYYSQILTYCRLHTQDISYGEDLTQETFIRFFHALPSYHHRGKARNFLYTIAGNLCRDYHRKRKELLLESLTEQVDSYGIGRTGKVDSLYFLQQSLGEAGKEQEDWDTRITVKMALAQLPEEIRETAILFFVQEQKQKDIARILGIKLSLVKYRIRRAREILSVYLQEEP